MIIAILLCSSQTTFKLEVNKALKEMKGEKKKSIRGDG